MLRGTGVEGRRAFSLGAQTVLAHTFEALTASLGVLRKRGFRHAGPGFEEVPGEERIGMGEPLLFRLDRYPPGHAEP